MTAKQQIIEPIALGTRQGADERPPLPYAGEVTPQEAWALSQRGDAVLVDVRTALEWHDIGHVPGSRLLPWNHADGQRNADFLADLREVVQPAQTVLFLCRSAVRSHHAAMAAAAAGYDKAFNVLEGFEGQPDPTGRRGRVNGWQARGLPWERG
jgi:rhodanese-related sulfurtransferase